MTTVLVVDDNAATRALVRRVVEGDGMEFSEACRGAEARSLVARTKPDLILLDLGLPDVSGSDLVEDLRAAVGQHVPILALTGVASAESRRAFTAFDDVVSKPLEAERLRSALRACLPEAPTTPRSFGNGRTLIVVDDDAVQRKMVAFKLTRLGFVVRTAADGNEALALARQERPDAVVSDVLMPNVDGFELCARLRADERFARMPILLLSNSYIEDSDRAFALRVGADAYVIRHPELVELTDSLRRSLDAPTTHEAQRFAHAPEAQHERNVRAARQLDRQVAQNAALAQRNALLVAQLAILEGLTSALAENRDVDAAMDAALGSCFDAGNISWGVLVVRQGDGWRRRSLGVDPPRAQALEARVPELTLKLRAEAERTGTRMGPQSVDLGAEGAESAHTLLAPILHVEELVGAFLLGSHAPFDEQRRAFAGVVAGQTAMVLALARAFQERERATDRERERAEQLSSILDAIGDPMIVLDDACKPLRWNEAAAPLVQNLSDPRITEWPALHGLYRPDQSTLFPWEELPLVRASRGETFDGEEVCVQKEGTDARWLSFTARPVWAAKPGTLHGAVAVIRDVTQAKRAQEREIVNDRMASIGVLAAGVAHEINNPMTSVLAELDMAIEDSEPGSDMLEKLRAARDAALRVTMIVRDLKTLSRGGATEDSAPVDLRRVIEAAVRMAAPETRPRARVTVELEELPRVMANESRLVQVLLNLLVNAAQSIGQVKRDGAPASGLERATAAHFIHLRGGVGPDGGAQLAIADSGAGMSPEVRARLFTPFFTTKPVGMGTGLGLSISHRIITGLGGTIECDSSPELGTVFRIWLPAAAGEPTSSRSTTAEPRRTRLRVLAVDPDPLTRQVIARGLRADHDLVLLESLGMGAARVSAGEQFDLLLCAVAHQADAQALLDQVASWSSARLESLTLLLPRALATQAGELASQRGAAFVVKPFVAADIVAFIKRRAAELGLKEDATQR